MIKIKYEKDNHRSAAYDDDELIGLSNYSQMKNIWIIDHTETNPEYGGQGIATKLVKALVDQARKDNVKILPLCPFAKAEFEKKAEYEDVLYRQKPKV